VKIGTDATIIDAFEAEVYIKPVFSKIKYRTMPKKPDNAIIKKCLRVIFEKAFVTRSHIIKVTEAIICLKKAIEIGGSSFNRTFVLIKE
jgi:hypothetical protein